MANVLVVGGAGYIGSHMVRSLLDSGHQVTTFDNLATGHADAVTGGELVIGDLGNPRQIQDALDRGGFDAVMHFASFIEVGESVADPGKYYRNNVSNTLSLLDAMVHSGVRRFVFSSSAAVYGTPRYSPLDEDHPCEPINPYGMTKWMVEKILADYARAYGMQSISLRYFNAAGADPAGRLGERHDPESHLIPLVLQAASGRREAIEVYGRDYDTPDGTCVRDYIHVVDLCDAHLLALESLSSDSGFRVYNLGNGDGFSVQQVIDTARSVCGGDIKVIEGNRRPGDPPVLVADATRARTDLGWRPRYTRLDTIIEHAWAWEQKLRSGSGGRDEAREFHLS
jgi:UDP-glucose 4-epimerase